MIVIVRAVRMVLMTMIMRARLWRRVLVFAAVGVFVNIGMFLRMNAIVWMRMDQIAVAILARMGVGVRMGVLKPARVGMLTFVAMVMLTHPRHLRFASFQVSAT